MKVILLPGYSYNNREEMQSIRDLLVSANLDVYAHEWMHWHDPNQVFDYRYELPEIKTAIGDQDYILITKSIGGYIGIQLIDAIGREPNLGIFMGVGAKDLDVADKEKYYEVLKPTSFKKIFVHNDDDPHGSSEQLKEFLKNIEYDFVEQIAADHRYNYPELVLKLIQDNTAQ